MSELALDFDDPDAKPYFLWSEEMTVRELRQILAGEQGEFLQNMYIGRILREARVREVWHFLTPNDIVQHWDGIQRHLGRSKKLWTYLLDVWDEHGLISR